MNNILLVGAGGHCVSVLDTIQSLNMFNEIAIIDIPDRIGDFVNNIRIIASDESLADLFSEYKYAFLSMGDVVPNNIKNNLYLELKNIGYTIPIIKDPSSIVSSSAKISEGCFIGKNAIVNANANIDICTIINTSAIVEHDVQIGRFCHLSPGAIALGHVVIEEYSKIGSNSVINPNLSIGNNSIIGSGSVVTKAISSNSVAYGNPCKEVTK
ncbi:acetyltransferase [Candidatus Xianfuyuplasma coldseepsis]|uniref:Acetyltransferase n=1 Tax=Candidatus Xianfuyuplasma coldseepsis TaxID=2782163 RepID=A0A7L7KQM3_9MOLU|nr:acetyltransferase [Xianfuyuplasma coldseepsis]QMS84526.1 acetyltransferase [Xianfuyuplasma coldseepsis]